MNSAPIKRSVKVNGHLTSVTLQEPFWQELRRIAKAHRITISGLISEIDRERGYTKLSAAIRVYVLKRLEERATQVRKTGAGPPA